MVKRVPVLDEVDREADLPYEATRLARDATRARPRVAWLLVAGAVALALEVILQRTAWYALPAALVALTAWRVRRGGLPSVIAAGFILAVALLLPIPLVAMRGWATIDILVGAIALTWGIMLAPGVLTLVRDAELQHAFGRWARRGI